MALLLALVACSEKRERDTFVYSRTTRDLLLDPPAFEVLTANPSAAHGIGEIMPAAHFQLDGTSMRSLVLPPPAAVRFSVGEFDGLRSLRLRAGVDFSAARWLHRKQQHGSFTFEVLLNGESVFSGQRSIPLDIEDEQRGTEWIVVGERGRLRVQSGDMITLRTNVLDDQGTPMLAPYGPRIGFGGLLLEERVRRKRARSAPDRPNLVMVVVDTLRRDRLSTYGYSRPTSPELDKLARRGSVFENAYATSSWTLPSTASLFTGLQVPEHGVSDSRQGFLAEELTTVAEVCRDAGMSRAGWSGNPLIHRLQNFDQGFSRLSGSRSGFRDTGEFFDEVETWLAAQNDRRFFLYLHLVEPHHPYRPLPRGAQLLASDVDDTDQRISNDVAVRVHENFTPGGPALPLDEVCSSADQRAVSNLYDACVWSADLWLGRVVETLERLGLDDRTVVAVTSDHGEELFERGYIGHGQTLHGELVAVPLVLAGPGVPAGRRFAAPVSNRALAPYLASRVGSEALGSSGLFDERGPGAVLFSTEVGVMGAEHKLKILGMRVGSHVVHYADARSVGVGGGAGVGAGSGAAGEPFQAAGLRQYDLASDPDERRDLSPPDQASARAIWEELQARFDAFRLARGVRSDQVSQETLELLERIGYIGR